MSTWTAIPVETNPPAIIATITFKNDHDHGGGSGRGSQHYNDIPTEFVFYAIIAIFLMIVVLMVKLLWNCEGDGGGSGGGGNEARPTESSGLLSAKEEALFSSYGTSEEDIESRAVSCSSSSDDLYDGKICVICYDYQRDCFFIPCGHCITCSNCAKRIVSEENKSCPICRTYINKVRMLHIL